MNEIAQTAMFALEAAMGANATGEIPGLGPAWACDRFGRYGHVWSTCRDCISKAMSQDEQPTTKGERH